MATRPATPFSSGIMSLLGEVPHERIFLNDRAFSIDTEAAGATLSGPVS